MNCCVWDCFRGEQRLWYAFLLKVQRESCFIKNSSKNTGFWRFMSEPTDRRPQKTCFVKEKWQCKFSKFCHIKCSVPIIHTWWCSTGSESINQNTMQSICVETFSTTAVPHCQTRSSRSTQRKTLKERREQMLIVFGKSVAIVLSNDGTLYSFGCCREWTCYCGAVEKTRGWLGLLWCGLWCSSGLQVHYFTTSQPQ